MHMTATATLSVEKWNAWNLEADGIIRSLKAAAVADSAATYKNAEIAKILYGAPQNAEFFAVLYARLLCEHGEFYSAGTIAREFVMPHLTAIAASQQVLAAEKQLASARLSFWTAIVLGTLAVVFSASQVYFAYTQAHSNADKTVVSSGHSNKEELRGLLTVIVSECEMRQKVIASVDKSQWTADQKSAFETICELPSR